MENRTKKLTGPQKSELARMMNLPWVEDFHKTLLGAINENSATIAEIDMLNDLIEYYPPH